MKANTMPACEFLIEKRANDGKTLSSLHSAWCLGEARRVLFVYQPHLDETGCLTLSETSTEVDDALFAGQDCPARITFY